VARKYTHTVLLSLVVLSVTVFVVFSFTPVDGVTGVSLDDDISGVAKTFGISQSGVDEGTWEIFAPDPGTTDVYYVFPAETRDGDSVDMYNERAVSYSRPYESLQKQYDTYRERFYMGRVVTDARRGFELGLPIPLAQYFCDSDRHGELLRLNMYVVQEEVTVDTVGTPAEREKEISRIYMHGCGNNEPELIEPPEGSDIDV